MAGDLVEHRIDHAGLLGLDKGVRDIDIFRDHDAAGHVLAVFEFIGSGAQYRAQGWRRSASGPALGERLVDQRIEFRLVADHAGDDVAEERRFGRQIFLALDLVAEPMALEFGEDVVDPRACDVHLVERLHRGKPRRASPVGFPVLLLSWPLAGFLSGVFCALPSSDPRQPALDAQHRKRRARGIAAFVQFARTRPRPGLGFRIDRDDAVAEREPLATVSSIRAREDSIATISKWMVSPRITQPSAIAAS